MQIRSITAIFNASELDTFKSNPVLMDAEFSFGMDNCWFFVNENYKTGIPQRIVWEGNLGIVLHGIVFPRNSTLDVFAKNPDPVLKEVLAKHQNDPQNIPYEFINGAYVGFVIDKANDSFYAFTSFLNSFPLYYCRQSGQLIFSTDFNKLAKLCRISFTEISNGLLEYYHLGANLSSQTALPQVQTVAKGACLKFNGNQITEEYYFKLPQADETLKFEEVVERFADLWSKNLNAIDSKNFKYGLGFTGGIDSRLILAGWPDKSKLVTFTGGQPLHPDYLIADKITKSLGINKNHHLEDYRKSEKLIGFKDMLLLADNPTLVNAVYFMDQFQFRKNLGFNFEMLGLTEYLGGTYHYRSRASIRSTIETTLPLHTSKLLQDNFKTWFTLIKLAMREDVFVEVSELLSPQYKASYSVHLHEMVALVNKQIITDHTVETYLEQFRHIHKMANLLTWSRLPGRNFNERISPSMNIELTDFTARIPLRLRENRKILLAYLKRYHPDFAQFVLSGSVFNANAPWFVHKVFDPYIKAFNAKGFKIPYLQWYIQKSKMVPSLQSTAQFKKFQQSVCEHSPFLKDTLFGHLYQLYKDHPKRRWRLFNIALLERRINLNDAAYAAFLDENYEKAK